MAISPKSKGLGNIGNIVNRQGIVSPTRPQVKPMAKMPVPKPAPMSRPKTTTLAQRQAMPSPFRSAAKPVAKVNPLTMQPAMPMTPMDTQPMVQKPAPQPFNPQPTPGQMPTDPFMGGMYGSPDVEPPMGGGYNPGQMPMDFGGLQTGQQLAQIGQQGLGQMFGGPGQQALQTGMQGLGQMFGGNGYQVGGNVNIDPTTGQPTPWQPDSMTSDYDQLEGSAFNTNPGGSLFSGGGFSGY